MTEMDKLTQKVKDGLAHHSLIGFGSCDGCPYINRPSCAASLSEDALKVVDYWKDKYESTLLQEPVMILNIPNQKIVSDPIDIRTTLKEAEALRKMADAGNKASEALREVTSALKDLKEKLDNEPPEIPEAVTAKWTYIKTPLGCSVWIGQCTHCGKVVTSSLGIGYPKVCPHCKAVITGVE